MHHCILNVIDDLLSLKVKKDYKKLHLDLSRHHQILLMSCWEACNMWNIGTIVKNGQKTEKVSSATRKPFRCLGISSLMRIDYDLMACRASVSEFRTHSLTLWTNIRGLRPSHFRHLTTFSFALLNIKDND